jgi:hypothetical protein
MRIDSPAQRKRRTWRSAIIAAPAWLIALVLPKCPLCFAALLTSLGVGATLSNGLAHWLQPFVLAWAGLGLVLLVAAALAAIAQRKHAARNCCKHA